MDPWAMVKGTPMARSTWDGWSDPEVQAEPEEAQMPEFVHHQQDGFAFDEFEADVPGVGQALHAVAVYAAVRNPAQELVLELVAQSLDLRVFRLPRWAASSQALPRPMMPAFSVPPRRPFSWWPPIRNGANLVPLRT